MDGGSMKNIRGLKTYASIFSIAVIFSCGGSTGAIGDTVVVEEVSNMPTIDIGGIDIVSPPSSSINTFAGKGLVIGDPSATGCMAINFFRATAMDALKQVDLSNCFIRETQDNSSNFAIPILWSDSTDQYRYYEFAMNDSAASVTGIKSMRVRLANIAVGSSNTLKIGACQSHDGTTFTHTNEYGVTGALSTHTWTGTLKARNINNADDPDCTTTPCFLGGASFEIVMSSASNMTTAFSWDNVTSALITSTRGRNPSTAEVTNSTTFDQMSDVIFGHYPNDATLGTTKQTLTGAFNKPDFIPANSLYAIYTETGGASKLSLDNTFGVYDNTQSFAPKADPIAIIDPATVGFFGDVGSATLPSADINAAIRAAVVFETAWDCEAPAENPFIIIDTSTLAYADCMKKVSELKKPTSDTITACFGTESFAGDYRTIMATPGGCAYSPSYTLSGSGPVYASSGGTSDIKFTNDNGSCSNAQIGDQTCASCEFSTISPVTSFNDCGGCIYQFEKL